MEKESESLSIENYLIKAQKLKILSTQKPDQLENLLQFVADQRENYPDTSEIAFLFKGEQAFHSGNFEQALINYMQARSVPEFEFFCYRATAFVSFIRGDRNKAKSFILKALDFRPHDYDTLRLYHEILTQNGEQEKAREIQEKINQTVQDYREHKSRPETTLETNNFSNSQTKSESSPKMAPQIEIKNGREEMSLMNATKSTTHQSGYEIFSNETTTQFIATKLGVDLDSEKALEIQIQEFQESQTRLIQNYLEESKRKRQIKDCSLYILNGWSSGGSYTHDLLSGKLPSDVLLMEQSRQISKGFFIRWNGVGIVINPGSNFLENFHRQGLYIGDINCVIVTQDSSESIADIKRIYDLNYQLNKISPELHVIDYYLNHKAYQDLSHTLKPNFKQERNTVHSLELFLDSPDVEREKLADGIMLNYFATASRAGYISHPEFQEGTRFMHANCVGIRLDLSKDPSESHSKTVNLGYISGTAWSPLLAHHLGHCHILIAGFGSTNSNDYGKLNYNENSLGYFGTYTLFEEVKPHLLLSTEFDGREGDIRLEVTRKLRKEYQKANSGSPYLPAILPADNGLFVDLETRQVACSITNALVDAAEIVVVKSSGTHGKLQYLSPTCIL